MTPDFSPATWRKSSHSSSSGGQCIEVAFVTDTPTWRKSTHSGSSGGACVEVAVQPTVVGVRDSKDVDGPVLAFDQCSFAAFLRSIKSA